MKFKTFVAAALASVLATSVVYAAPVLTKVDDINSTSMQQMPSDGNSGASDSSVVPGPMAENNIGALPPTSMPSSSADNTNTGPTSGSSMDSPQASNNMDPQSVSAATGDSDMSADTATGDDDY